jgi:hypothetical protein
MSTARNPNVQLYSTLSVDQKVRKSIFFIANGGLLGVCHGQYLPN